MFTGILLIHAKEYSMRGERNACVQQGIDKNLQNTTFARKKAGKRPRLIQITSQKAQASSH